MKQIRISLREYLGARTGQSALTINITLAIVAFGLFWGLYATTFLVYDFHLRFLGTETPGTITHKAVVEPYRDPISRGYGTEEAYYIEYKFKGSNSKNYSNSSYLMQYDYNKIQVGDQVTILQSPIYPAWNKITTQEYFGTEALDNGYLAVVIFLFCFLTWYVARPEWRKYKIYKNGIVTDATITNVSSRRHLSANDTHTISYSIAYSYTDTAQKKHVTRAAQVSTPEHQPLDIAADQVLPVVFSQKNPKKHLIPLLDKINIDQFLVAAPNRRRESSGPSRSADTANKALLWKDPDMGPVQRQAATKLHAQRHSAVVQTDRHGHLAAAAQLPWTTQATAEPYTPNTYSRATRIAVGAFAAWLLVYICSAIMTGHTVLALGKGGIVFSGFANLLLAAAALAVFFAAISFLIDHYDQRPNEELYWLMQKRLVIFAGSGAMAVLIMEPFRQMAQDRYGFDIYPAVRGLAEQVTFYSPSLNRFAHHLEPALANERPILVFALVSFVLGCIITPSRNRGPKLAGVGILALAFTIAASTAHGFLTGAIKKGPWSLSYTVHAANEPAIFNAVLLSMFFWAGAFAVMGMFLLYAGWSASPDQRGSQGDRSSSGPNAGAKDPTSANAADTRA